MICFAKFVIIFYSDNYFNQKKKRLTALAVAVFCIVMIDSESVAHGAEEFVVVAGALHTVFDKFHGFDAVAVA